jgi:hypothetical protein
MWQPGTGSIALLGTLQYTMTAPLGFSGALGATYQRSSPNHLAYGIGDEAILTLRVGRPVVRRLTATVQVKGWGAARNVYRGQASPSTGGVVLYVAPGLTWMTPLGAVLYGTVQLPVYQKLNESQLGTRCVTLLDLARSF